MREKYFKWVKILSIIGVILALYLLFEQATAGATSVCNFNSRVNCNAVINGEVSKTLGIPTPLFGLVGYIVILFAALRKKTKLVLGMAAFGLGFCLYIAYREIFQLGVICPVCILCQIDMISVFILGILLLRIKEH